MKNFCKVCRGRIPKTGRPGRPKTTHTRCKKKKKKTQKKAKKKKVTKKKAKKKKKKKKVTKKKAKKKKKAIKRSKTTRRGSSTTRSQQGPQIRGARGWLALWNLEGTSDKTWAVKVEKKGSRYRVLTRWGRRTGQKNVTKHPWTSKESALKKANSLLKQKFRKKYFSIGANRRKRRHKSRR